MRLVSYTAKNLDKVAPPPPPMHWFLDTIPKSKWQKLNFQFKVKILKKNWVIPPCKIGKGLKNQYFIFILALDFVSMSNFTMKYE